ncbi:MAG TPA: ATP-binding protein [Pyrinomonadaceae bacterium]
MKLLQEIDSLAQIDIEALMSRGLREGPQLEYKETLLPLNDQKKFELLKDVSSMANSEGGVIVFGVKQDQTGAPTSLPGLEIENVDELHNRLDQILNDNLDERLSGLRHRAIPRSDGKYFYVIQVPASYLAPQYDHDAFDQAAILFTSEYSERTNECSTDQGCLSPH